MGEYWTLSIRDYSVLEGKNSFDSSMLQLFRHEDKNARRVKSPQSEHEEYQTYEYTSTVEEMRERMDLMGFTHERTVHDFYLGRERALEQHDDLGSAYGRFLRGYSFDHWLSTMSSLIRSGANQLIDSAYPHVGSVKEFICSYDHYDALHGFFASDTRFVLRGCLEAAPAQSQVKLDLADLINAGYLDEDPDVRDALTDAALEYARTTPVVVLTEGSSDRWILESTLPLVYPHLNGFFSFMDFDTANASGGAGQLVATIKAFVGSGIRSRILAVFDNDTAAHAALRGLEDVAIPPNIRCCTLPMLRSARRYPTLGPQGRRVVDVNGTACSIELFFGADVLGRGKSRAVVRWKGLDPGTGQYQGEIEGKKSLQEKFRCKLQAATPAGVKADSSWRNIRELWAYLKTNAQAISLDMIRATERVVPTDYRPPQRL